MEPATALLLIRERGPRSREPISAEGEAIDAAIMTVRRGIARGVCLEVKTAQKPLSFHVSTTDTLKTATPSKQYKRAIPRFSTNRKNSSGARDPLECSPGGLRLGEGSSNYVMRFVSTNGNALLRMRCVSKYWSYYAAMESEESLLDFYDSAGIEVRMTKKGAAVASRILSSVNAALQSACNEEPCFVLLDARGVVPATHPHQLVMVIWTPLWDAGTGQCSQEMETRLKFMERQLSMGFARELKEAFRRANRGIKPIATADILCVPALTREELDLGLIYGKALKMDGESLEAFTSAHITSRNAFKISFGKAPGALALPWQNRWLASLA